MQGGLGFEDVNVWEDIRRDFEWEANTTMVAFRSAIESAEAAADAEIQRAKDVLDRAPARLAGRAEEDYIDTIFYWTQPLRLLRSMALVALCALLERARCRWEIQGKWQGKTYPNGPGLPDKRGYSKLAAIEGMKKARHAIVHQAGYIDSPLPPITEEGENAPTPPPARPDGVPPEYKVASGTEINVTDEILERDLREAIAYVEWYSREAHQNGLKAQNIEGGNGG